MTATSVAENGDLVETKTFEYILVPFAMERNPKEYNEEMGQLKKMIIEGKINLLVIGANSLIANRFRMSLRE